MAHIHSRGLKGKNPQGVRLQITLELNILHVIFSFHLSSALVKAERDVLLKLTTDLYFSVICK